MEEFVRWFGPCFGLAMVIYWLIRFRQEKSDEVLSEPTVSEELEDNRVQKVDSQYDGLDIKTMLERVLKNVGCHINMCGEKEGEFNITYQGEHFSIAYSENSRLINIYDVAWYAEDLNDIDNLSLVRQAVNMCNQYNSATVLYTIDKENNRVNVHTRQSVAFGSFIPDIEAYLRSRLEDSFQQHHNFYRCMEVSRKEQFA